MHLREEMEGTKAQLQVCQSKLRRLSITGSGKDWCCISLSFFISRIGHSFDRYCTTQTSKIKSKIHSVVKIKKYTK